MNIYSHPKDELVILLREWCSNNPHNALEYKTGESVPSWNKGIPTSDETKKEISNAKKGISVNKGLKRPYARENLKKITHRAYGQFEITEPSGRKIIITDLKTYCKQNDLKYTSMSSLSNGKWPTGTYKGYKSKKLGYVKIHQLLRLNFSND